MGLCLGRRSSSLHVSVYTKLFYAEKPKERRERERKMETSSEFGANTPLFLARLLFRKCYCSPNKVSREWEGSSIGRMRKITMQTGKQDCERLYKSSPSHIYGNHITERRKKDHQAAGPFSKGASLGCESRENGTVRRRS